MSTNADLIGRKTVGKMKNGTATRVDVTEANGLVNQIKHAGKGLVKFVSVDGDAVFKSKEWPYY